MLLNILSIVMIVVSVVLIIECKLDAKRLWDIEVRLRFLEKKINKPGE